MVRVVRQSDICRMVTGFRGVMLSACITGLSACGGGGGGNQITPSVVSDFLSPSATELLAGQLADADADGLSLFSLNTDSHIPLFYQGRDAIDSFLAKQPSFDRFEAAPTSITTSSLSSAWIAGASDTVSFFPETPQSDSQNGLYLMWGTISTEVPAADITALNYNVSSEWRCGGCRQPVLEASGQFELDLGSHTGQLSLTGDALSLALTASLNEGNHLSLSTDISAPTLTLDGSPSEVVEVSGAGALFGDRFDEAGMVISLSTERARLTGAVIGTRQ